MDIRDGTPMHTVLSVGVGVLVALSGFAMYKVWEKQKEEQGHAPRR